MEGCGREDSTNVSEGIDEKMMEKRSHNAVGDILQWQQHPPLEFRVALLPS